MPAQKRLYHGGILAALHRAGTVDEDTALLHCPRRTRQNRELQRRQGLRVRRAFAPACIGFATQDAEP